MADQAIAADFLGGSQVSGSLPVLHPMGSSMAGGSVFDLPLPVRHSLRSSWLGVSALVIALHVVVPKPTTAAKRPTVPVVRVLPTVETKNMSISTRPVTTRTPKLPPLDG